MISSPEIFRMHANFQGGVVLLSRDASSFAGVIQPCSCFLSLLCKVRRHCPFSEVVAILIPQLECPSRQRAPRQECLPYRRRDFALRHGHRMRKAFDRQSIPICIHRNQVTVQAVINRKPKRVPLCVRAREREHNRNQGIARFSSPLFRS